jgi:hypothetical protein
VEFLKDLFALFTFMCRTFKGELNLNLQRVHEWSYAESDEELGNSD